ncbi:amidohydrolase family protein [Brenneria goodwinii]|uniref:S-adenosylhomocysteine deaminase Methylthioadenosine deaminase n=1 Tax=Brenneria goodwinii TaxID=1109412 RepID=A0A0G4K2U9_9GAMM|nr:amidohydrolase [Brenneria goodwinii]CPR21538.1 S-adenosylhomocysteine deaminase; Methylthioadenosine deaminase [Brenneria goodwinii]
MKYTVITNVVIFTVDSRDRVIRNGTVIVKNGLIAAVGKKEEIQIPTDADEIIDGRGQMALLPGLVDSHNHSSLMRGVAEDLRLVDWLPIYDLEHRACNEEDAYHAARLTYLECLKNGTTTIMDMYRFMHRSAEAARELGIRVHLAPYAADIQPYDFFESTKSNEQLIKTHHMSQNGKIRVWMGLENLYYCSEAMYKAAVLAQREFGVGIHTHGCEQQEEEQSIIKTFGKSTIDMLEQRGILGEKTLLAHCVWVNDDDIKKMAATGTNLAHCAISAAKLGCGIARIPRMLQEGINVSIGSDGVIDNNSMDLFQEMKFASLIQKATQRDASIMGAGQMLRMATINGAKSLNMENEIGSIEVGKSADMILVNVFKPNLQPVFWNEEDVTNLLWNIVFSAKGENVDTVMVQGEILVRHGRTTKASETEIMLMAQQQGEDWMKRRERYK